MTCGAQITPTEALAGEAKPAFDEHDIRTLVCHPSTAKRAGAAQRICEAYAAKPLTAADREFADKLLHAMAEDAAQLVRAALSVTLCNSPALPHDVAQKLADDVDTIAVPIIRFSPVLSDDDIVSVLRSRAAAKLRAAAQRSRVSVSVTRSIIRFGDSEAVARLAANDGAEFDEGTAREMIRLWHADDLITEAMVSRRDMPIDVLEVLVAHTSAETALAMEERGLPRHLATDVANRARERATLVLSEAARTPTDLEVLIDSLHARDRLTGSVVFRAICQGHIAFAELALAKLSELSVAKTRVLLHDSGPFGIRSLARKAFLPSRFTGVLVEAMRIYRDLSRRDIACRGEFSRRLAERIATGGLDLDEDDCRFVMERLDAA